MLNKNMTHFKTASGVAHFYIYSIVFLLSCHCSLSPHRCVVKPSYVQGKELLNSQLWPFIYPLIFFANKYPAKIQEEITCSTL